MTNDILIEKSIILVIFFSRNKSKFFLSERVKNITNMHWSFGFFWGWGGGGFFHFQLCNLSVYEQNKPKRLDKPISMYVTISIKNIKMCNPFPALIKII